MTYVLKLHREVEKQLRRIPQNQRERLVEAMRSLRVDPRPHGCQHLQDELYRLRKGEYRMIYAVFEQEVIVVVCKVTRITEKTYRDLKILLDKALQDLLG
jgi:mRNA interferase RelE/StbE